MAGFQIPGDLVLSDDRRRFVRSSGGRLAKERLTTALETGLTAWRYDRRKGFPYRDVFDAPYDAKRIQMIYTEFLASFAWVDSVAEVTPEYDKTERHLKIRWRVFVDGEAVEGTQTI